MISRLLVAATWALIAAGPAPAASLTLLPEWFGRQSVRNLWMMPDGQTITGVDGNDVFRWSQSSGRTNIGTMPSTINSLPVKPTAVSDDGNVIIGKLGGDIFHPLDGFMWTPAGGAVVMPSPPHNPNARAIPTALSSDGSVIVGNEFTFEWKGAFRWTAAKGFMPLDGVGFASAISADGSVVVGSGPLGEDGTQAIRWSPATGGVGLGVLPDSWLPISAANLVSADGAILVGYVYPPEEQTGPKIFRWTEADGMQPIAPGEYFPPIAISADANVILGSVRTRTPGTGTIADYLFIWTPDAGVRTLPELLLSLGVDDVDPLSDGMKAQHIYKLSADGRTAFGVSSRVEFTNDPYLRPIVHNEYWLLDITPVPEPSTLAMVWLPSLLIVLSGRRRPEVD